MTGDEIKRCAFLLNGVSALDEVLETLARVTQRAVRLGFDTGDCGGKSWQTWEWDAEPIFDHSVVVAGLRHMRGLQIAELAKLGIDIEKESLS